MNNSTSLTVVIYTDNSDKYSSQISNKDELIQQLRGDLECLHRQQKETTAKVNDSAGSLCADFVRCDKNMVWTVGIFKLYQD